MFQLGGFRGVDQMPNVRHIAQDAIIVVSFSALSFIQAIETAFLVMFWRFHGPRKLAVRTMVLVHTSAIKDASLEQHGSVIDFMLRGHRSQVTILTHFQSTCTVLGWYKTDDH